MMSLTKRLVFFLISISFSNMVTAEEISKEEMLKPLNAKELNGVRVIASQILSQKRAEKPNTSEALAVEAELAEIRQLIMETSQQGKLQTGAVLLSIQPNSVIREESISIVEKKHKHLHEMASKLKQFQLRMDSSEINNNHVRGLSENEVQEKRDEVQKELEQALSANDEEREAKLKLLADRLTPHKLSEDNERVLIQPEITTITKHRDEQSQTKFQLE